MLALAGCGKEAVVVEPDRVAGEEIMVNLSIARSDEFDGTRATVKDSWADGDVVFVFFKGISAPKYLEMKYSGGAWTPTAKNGLEASELKGVSEKKMTAVYLPYGSGAAVKASGSDFIFDGGYCGWFLQSEGASYSYGSELYGVLDMKAPAVSGALIHFDISGFTSGKEYNLYQELVRPLTFTGVSSGGGVVKEEGGTGEAIPGYEHSSTVMSFSGVLDASALGEDKDYEFSIDDSAASVLYTRGAGTRKLDKSKYIGIGNIGDPAVWNSTEYVYLGIDIDGQRLCIARKNLGAAAESGEGSYGLFYAQGVTTGYPLDGTFGSYTCSHDFSADSTVNPDEDSTLPLEYDAAHVALKGLWRMPTYAELKALAGNTVSSSSDEVDVSSGTTFTSTVEGYSDKSVFIPAAGLVDGTNPIYQGQVGTMCSSFECGPGYLWSLICFIGGEVSADGDIPARYGRPVRPVFCIQ